ncbi:MAG TPA: sigma-54 dependent transcriptional regulator [Vicinamibacteria bacterium]|nr:sigma-54 dependent transcriptional regulator [Vicinamibacteria bacterium]
MSDLSRRTRILVVDDEEIVRESLSGWLQKDGYTLAVAPDGPAALAEARRAPWSILLVDLKMPGMDGLTVLEEVKKLQPEAAVVIMTAYATIDTAVTAMKNGAYDYLVKPFDPEELSHLIRRIVESQALLRENVLLRKVLRRDYRFRDLLSKSPAMQAVFDLAKTAARSPSTILILGESGTGKELLARAIHAESLRSREPFVPVSCAALTETLLESELFGYEKGAFTGAGARRQGKFEAADRGSLFLDEIGDISPKLQMDLLRVLEERRFFRVGGNEPLHVDVRILAATNRDLKKAVAEGQFREDLFYRLNVIPITLPPLRERKEDIPLLAQHFIERLDAELQRKVEGLTAEAMEILMRHQWPGNIRELRNTLERAIVVASGHLIQAKDLGLALAAATEPGAAGGERSRLLSLSEVEREHVARVLKATGGNVSQAARVLGIDRVTLYAKMKKYDIRRPEDQSAENEETATR